MIYMRAKASILIFISLLLLVGTVAAHLPDNSTIISDNSWVVANGVDQSTITVIVSNLSSGSVEAAGVTLTIDNPDYGTLGPVTVVSDRATSTFRANTTSGVAVITASITSHDGYTVTKTMTQNIDHDSPYIVTFTHPPKGNVTEEVPFGLSVTDRHGNPIDDRNKNETHIVSLHVYGPSDDCGFKTNMGYVHDSHVTLNETGKNASLIKLTSKIGNNYISMDPFGSISDKIESILAVANGVPDSLKGTISNGGILPVSNEIPANGLDKFTINYFLYDVYKNPLQNRSVLISTNLTDELTPQSYRTNSLGQIQITYGPKVSVLTANITAVADGYPGVTNNSYAKFVGSDIAANLYLVVTPQTMASRDCDSSTTRQAMVVAILSDEWGNPVTNGEDVTFTISGVSTNPNDALPNPSFDSGTEILNKTISTDGNGNAILTFYPGSFVTNSDSSTGYCTITATTGAYTSNPVTVEWKNFAYLSVAINATPRTVLVNDTIDITIRVTGDGYNMVSNPINVVLDLDATSNLAASSDGTNGKTRWINAQEASTTFVKNMSDQDKIGLVTHGEWTNYIYWQLIQNISYNKPLVLAAIPNLTPSGGLGGNATTLKDSIIVASDSIVSNPLYQPGEIDAIVTIGANSYAKNYWRSCRNG